MEIGPWVFNSFDIAVIVICLISFVWSFQKGFAKELIALLALFLAIVATLFAWGQYRPRMREFIKDPEWLADGVLGIGVFFLVFFLVGFLLRNVSGTKGDPSFGNKLLGGGFGIIRGLFLVGVVTLVWNSNYRDKAEMAEQYGAPNPVKASLFTGSTIYPVIEKIEHFILALPLPEIRNVAEDLADGKTDEALDGAKDIIDDNK